MMMTSRMTTITMIHAAAPPRRFPGPSCRRRPFLETLKPQLRILTLTNSSAHTPPPSISAKPSSQLRKTRNTAVDDDSKLTALRSLFSTPSNAIDAYIIPSQDAHQSEFIAECYMRRAYISGFTGSAGTAVVTKEMAALWTDGRYFLQAEKQLNSSWTLMRAGNSGVPSTSEWLNNVLSPGSRIGIDPFLFSSNAVEELREAITSNSHELVYLYEYNLVDKIWNARPKPPSNPIRVHDLKYAGVDVSSKLSNLRSELSNAGSSAIVLSMLDEIAWLLNLRGNDIPHSPVMYAYLIVEADAAKLFVDNSKVTREVASYLKSAGVELKAYESILSEIKSLAAKGAHLWLDTSSVNAAIASTYAAACDEYSGGVGSKTKVRNSTTGHSGGPPAAIYRPSPVSLLKSLKNFAELEGMRNSHLRTAPKD